MHLKYFDKEKYGISKNRRWTLKKSTLSGGMDIAHTAAPVSDMSAKPGEHQGASGRTRVPVASARRTLQVDECSWLNVRGGGTVFWCRSGY